MNALKDFLADIDIFGMVDRFWANHEKDGLVEATPQRVLCQTGFQATEENLMLITDRFFDEMRKEYPHSILVCHL